MNQNNTMLKNKNWRTSIPMKTFLREPVGAHVKCITKLEQQSPNLLFVSSK